MLNLTTEFCILNDSRRIIKSKLPMPKITVNRSNLSIVKLLTVVDWIKLTLRRYGYIILISGWYRSWKVLKLKIL